MAGEKRYTRIPQESTGDRIYMIHTAEIEYSSFNAVAGGSTNHTWQIGDMYTIDGFGGTGTVHVHGVFDRGDGTGILAVHYNKTAKFEGLEPTVGEQIQYNGEDIALVGNFYDVYIPAQNIMGYDNPEYGWDIDRFGSGRVTFFEGNPQITGMGSIKVNDARLLASYDFSKSNLPNEFVNSREGGSDVSNSWDEATRSVKLAVGTTSGDRVTQTSNLFHSYEEGSNLLFIMSARSGDAGKEFVARNWGAFDATDGFFFQIKGSDDAPGGRATPTAPVGTGPGSALRVVHRFTFNGVTKNHEILQKEWNSDTLLGTGGSSYPSGKNLDVTKINTYWIANTLIFNPDSYNGEISMIDGSGGLGGENGPAFSTEIFISKGAGDLYPGGLGTDVAFDPDTEPNSGAEKPVSNRRGTVWNTGLVGIIENMRYIHPDVEYSPGFASEERQPYNDPTDPTDADRTSTPFTDLGSFLSVGVDGEALSSFKTRDYHDFGIVYYDQRGRAGYVNSLPSAYVPGYSDAERGEGQKGRVAVKYKLLHAPPEWADSYRIVYSGSANTYRFIQYSAGGAFTEPSSSGGADSSIYVSLNYLQGKKASYAGSFGAVDQDTGENVLYRYTPGDKLRVISYYTDDETIVYAPADFEFDVIGVEEISEESESPLYDENELYEDENLERIRRSGSFVLLRNNVSADGFNAFAVGAGTDFWRNRCIFEIYSPRKSRGDEQIPYYETPFGGKIVTQNGTRIHQYGTITIDQGDVFFRQVPVNINSYNATDQKFNEILSAEENTSGGYPVDTSESRFKGYFLESNSAIDLFRSNAKSYGKMHFKVDGARERLNDSSIIYSAPTNQESFNLFYTSFSPVIKNYFDLPNKHGDIDYISDFGSDLFFAQNSKVGFLQVERSLTSTAAGQDTVNISSDVIGSPRYFPEDVGTDGHPESVTVTNASALFVDKSRGLVVTAGLRGMDILSSADMTTFFKNMLEVYPEDVRIVTGFNPRTEEYIVSMFDPSLSNSIIDPSNSINQYELAEDGVNTYAYDVKGKAWVTSYSFHSTEYSSVGDVFVSYKSMPIDDQDYGACIWKHDDEKKNSFYGSTYPSYFKSVLSQNPNSSKDYRSVSIDGTDPWDLKLYTTKELSTITNFTAYEDTYYSDVLRSENTSSKTNTKSVGVVVDFDARGRDVRLTFKRDISQYHITLSEEEEIAKCYFLGASGGSLADFTTSTGRKVIMTPRKVIGKNQLQITLRPELSDFELLEVKNFVTGRTLVVSSSSRFYGDSLRDKYLCIEARLTPSENQRPELYSINVDYIPSFLDSSR